MRTYFRLVAISAFFIAGAAIIGQVRRPLDPPPGPVQPTGPSLTDLMTAINGLGGAGQGSAVPGDLLYASLPLPLVNQTVYFQVSGVTGDVTTPASYSGWSAAISAGQSMSHPAASQAQFSSFRILANLDRAFVPLMQRGTLGTAIPDATIDFLQTFPSGPVRYLRVHLVNPQVVTVTPIFQAKACLYELSFARIEWTYTPLGPNGQPSGSDILFCWNRQTNTQCN